MVNAIHNASATAALETAAQARTEARSAAAEARSASLNPASAQAATTNDPVQARPAAYGVAAKPVVAESRRDYDARGQVRERPADDARGRRVDRDA